MRSVVAEVFDKPPLATGPDDLLCFFTVYNEASRIPYFLQYYRAMGVTHFFAIDNRSTDGSADLLRREHDVRYFYTDQTYVESRAGRLWTSELARFYGQNRWCLTLDVDEILVFPGSEALSLHELTGYMDQHGQRVLFTVFLDMYNDRALNEAVYQPGRPFFDTCNYYEDATYQLRPAMHYPPVQIFGGPRQRIFWEQSKHGMGPCMRKAPLVKWGPDSAYINSTHSFAPLPMSDVTGATLHFKFFSSFIALAKSEVERGDRIQMADYKKYVAQFDRESVVLYNESSVEYQGSLDLLARGTITCSRRFVNYAGGAVRRKEGAARQDVFREAALAALEGSLDRSRLSLKHLPAVWPLVSKEYTNPLASAEPVRDLPPSAAPPLRVALEGQVLDASGGKIIGWVRDLLKPEASVPVAVRSSGGLLATGFADVTLPEACDLPESVQGKGFSLDIGEILELAGEPTTIDVVAGEHEFPLVRGVTVYPDGTSMRDTPYEGAVENNDKGMIRGWAWRKDLPHASVDVALYLDNFLWRRVVADNFRRDLQSVGKGTGQYGFALPVPSPLQDGRERTIDLRIADTGIRLRRAPLKVAGHVVVASAPP